MRNPLFASLAVWFIFGFIPFALVGKAQTPTVETLQVGKPVERELKARETHTYQLRVEAGTFIYLVFDHAGIQVVATLVGPDGKQLLEMSRPTEDWGAQILTFVTEQAGDYQVRIRPNLEEAKPGRYQARLLELRPARPLDAENKLADAAALAADQLAIEPSKTNTPKAIELYQTAQKHWHAAGNQLQEALALQAIAYLNSYLGDLPKTLDFNNQALVLFRAVGYAKGEAVTLQLLGTCHSQMGQFEKSLAAHNEAAQIFRRLGNRSAETGVLSNLAVTYSRIGNRQKSQELYSQALALRRAEGNRQEEGRILVGMGGNYRELGNVPKSVELYHQALLLNRETGDRRMEPYTMQNLAVSYNDLGENQKALDLYLQALGILREIGDKTGEARTLTNLGSLYFQLGDFPQALEYQTQVLTLARALGNRPTEGIALHSLGVTHSKMGNAAKAIEFYQQALSLQQAAKDRRGEAVTLVDWGNVLRGQREFAKAREKVSQALAIHREIGNRSGEASSLQILGRIAQDQGEKEQAMDNFQQALAIRQALGDRRSAAATLSTMADANYSWGNYAAAKPQIESALQLVELLRSNVASRTLRATYLASITGYYSLYLNVLLRLHQENPKLGYDREALRVSEQSRARGLLDLLAESGTNIRQGVDPALLEKEQQVQKAVSTKLENLTRLLTGKHSDEQEAAAKKEIEALTAEYRQVQDRIRQTSPRYAALTQPKTLTVPEIQQLLDGDSMLLEFSLGDRQSWLFAVTKETFQAYQLPKRTEIEPLARRVNELLTARSRLGPSRIRGVPDLAETDREYWAVAAQLSDLILQPVAPYLGNRRLLMGADGILQFVPFGALPKPKGSGVRGQGSGQNPDRQGGLDSSPTVKEGSVPDPRLRAPDPLLVSHEIVSLPSISTLAVLRAEKQDRKAPTKMLAVLADPVFGGGNDSRLQSLTGKKPVPVADSNLMAKNEEAIVRGLEQEGDPGTPVEGKTRQSLVIRRLPGTRLEADAIVGLVPPADAIEALDFAASRTLATSESLGQYRYVHFATHGLLDSDHPELTSLVLSMFDQEGNPQDGFLRVFDVYNLNLPAEVVTLSACKTGLGKEVRGEGIIGLTRGFMYAGAQRVVVSLWNVEDRSTAELMKYFYQGMLGKEPLRPAAALRAAQLRMRRQKRWEAPFYWAGFVLQGEPK